MKNNFDSKAMLDIIKDLSKEKEISLDKIAEILEESMTKTFNRVLPDCKLEVKVDIAKGTIEAWWHLTVIECEENFDYDDFNEIPLFEIKKLKLNLKPGDIYRKPYDLNKEFTRPQAIQALQLFRQRLTEINNYKIYKEWFPRIGEVVYSEVEKDDERGGYAIVNLDSNSGFVAFREKIPGEKLIPGKRYKFFIKDVKEQTKGWPIILSRADAGLVSYLLTTTIPDVQAGTIKIEKIARIPGIKTKIAVSTINNAIDPASICIGPKANHVKAISAELHGEKIDIINYNENLETFIINACGRDKVVGIDIVETIKEKDFLEKSAVIIVKPEDLPVIIGKKGVNIRLIARIAECNIDIKTMTQAKEEGIKYKKINSNEYKKQIINNLPSMQHSNDEILEELDSLSEEEKAKLYDIDSNMQLENSKTNYTKNIHHKKTKKEIKETIDNSLDLSEVFQDEISDLLSDDNGKTKK